MSFIATLLRCSMVAALLGALMVAPPAKAQTLIDNINGITLDEDGEVVRFTAMVIDADGRVAQLLNRRDDRPEKLQYTLDGKGKYVIPGLIDAHGHVMNIGFQALSLDLSGTQSLAQAQQAIADYAAANPELPWIIGRGWNQEKWGLGRFPTAKEIDAVVADRPVYLGRVDGHAGWANSRAMELAGITAATKSPAGGRIETVNGQPIGILVDAAEELMAPVIPPARPIDRDQALQEAQKILLAQGITAIADMGTSIEDWQSFRRAGDSGRLNIRIMSYAAGIDNMIAIAGPGPSPWLYQDKLRLNGVKLYLDGALGSRGAWLKSDYADKPGERGLPFLNDTQLLNLMSRASMDNFQLAIHAIGDRANKQVLDAMDELKDIFGTNRRWRIEHAQILDPQDIMRFADLGAIASMQPVHQTSDRIMAEQRLGPARLDGAYAWASLEDAGVILAFGSDAPVESANPFAALAVAMTREDENRQPFGGWYPKERLSRESSLAGFTVNAAYAGFAEGRFGSLMPGNHADFLIVDQDIMLASPSTIRNMKPLETWISGVKVWQE